jgi:nitroreductase
MDIITTILTRRSVRQFSSEPVSLEDVTLLLKCAMQAPTAGNAQSWKFIVINDRQVLDQIPGIQKYAGFVYQAPMGILVCGDDILNKRLWIQDAAVAAQTILLATHGKGLGACWLAVEPFAKFISGFRDLLLLPDNIHPVCFLAIGHPVVATNLEDRYDLGKVHFNAW